MQAPSDLAASDTSPGWTIWVLAAAAVWAALSLKPTARILLEHRRLLKSFVVRDLKVRYVGSSIGFFWSVIFPFINLVVYMFVFRLILGVRWGGDTPPSQAALYMLVGILVWTAFSETVIRATSTLVDNANLIKKVVFPSEVLPPFLTLSSLVNMSIGIPVVLVFLLALSTEIEGPKFVFDAGRLGLPLVALPLLIALQAVFTAGLGFFFATLNVYLRDVSQIIGVGMTVWMFGTPIFYPFELVQQKGYGWLIDPNPMFWLVEAYRDVMLKAAWPDWMMVLRFALVSLIVFALGARLFQKNRQSFPDLL